MPEKILTADNTAFGGKSWWAVIYTPEGVATPERVVALLPTKQQALRFVADEKDQPERHRCAAAWLNPSSAWTVTF